MSYSFSKLDVPFGVVPNKLLNNSNISLKAKGLYGFMQSKPIGWKFSAKNIANQNKESVDSISNGLKELEKFGFLKREKKPTANGFTVTYTLVYEQFDLSIFSDEKPITENPILENPILENPIIGKTLNNSKKEDSKKEISKKDNRESALDFLKNNFPSEFEMLMMKFKSQIKDWNHFEQIFNAKVDTEQLEYDLRVLRGRFTQLALNWIKNDGKYEGEKKVEGNKEKVGGF